MKQNDEVTILLEALKYFYPGYFGEEVHPAKSFFEYNSQKYSKNWTLSETFRISKVPEKTSDIGVAIRELEKINSSKIVEAPKRTVDSTVPEAGTRAVQEEIREQRDVAKLKAEEKGKEQTQRFIDQQQERVQRLRDRKIKVVLKENEKIPTTTLNQNDKQKLYDLAQAVKIDPGSAQKIIEEKIEKSLENSSTEIRKAIPKVIVTKTAVDLIEKVRPFTEFKTVEEIPNQIPSMNPVSPLVPITILEDAKLKGLIVDEQERKTLVEMSQHLSLAIDNERNFSSTLVSQILPQNIVYTLYGPPQITQFEVAEDQSDRNQDGIELDVKEIYDKGGDVKDIWEKISSRSVSQEEVFNTSSTFVSSYTPLTSLAINSEASSLVSGSLMVGGGIMGFQGGLLLSSWASQSTPLLMNPQIAGLLTSGGAAEFATTSGILSSSSFSFVSAGGKLSFGVFTGTAENGAKLFAAGVKFGTKASGIATVSTQAGVKVATSGIFAKIGATLGALGTPIGIAIGVVGGWLVGKIVEKIPWDKVKKISAIIIGGLAGLVALLFVGTGAAVGVFLGTTGVAAAFGGGVGGLTLAGFGRGIFNFFRTIASATLGAIGIPILVTFTVFPLVVALILFIINSGAYVVPSHTLDNPFGEGTSINCSTEKGPVGVDGPTSSSPIANRAWKITYDLYQGFWCFWNRSPGNPPNPDFPNDVLTYPAGYPNLFNYRLFKTNPNGAAGSYGSEDLFWCTWLVVKSYRDNGNNIGVNLWVPNMYDDFSARGKIVSAEKATSNNVVPGSVIFFHVTTGENRLNHVGVVYSVDPGGITIVESNAPLKSQTANFKPGGGIGNLPSMEIRYFGLP